MTFRSEQQFIIATLDTNYGVIARPSGAVFRANSGCVPPIDQC